MMLIRESHTWKDAKKMHLSWGKKYGSFEELGSITLNKGSFVFGILSQRQLMQFSSAELYQVSGKLETLVISQRQTAQKWKIWSG